MGSYAAKKTPGGTVVDDRLPMRVLVVIVIMGLLAGARTAAAQQPPPPPTAAADTIAGNVPNVAAGLRYTGGVKGNVTRVSMENRATGTVSLLNGFTSITILSATESKYRLQDRKDNAKSFSTS
ncbi:MAG: hypothetical protein P8181_15225, partial [bacterium]